MPNKNISKTIKSPQAFVTTYDNGNVEVSMELPVIYRKDWYTTGTNNGRVNRPISAYSMLLQEWDAPLGSYHRRNKQWGSTTVGSPSFYGHYPNMPSLASRHGVAINQALNSFKGGGANAAVAFAEGQKTVDMIASKVKAVRFFASWAKNGYPGGRPSRRYRRKARRSRSQDEVQSKWLELQYGWLPLMSDLDGLMSALAGNIAHGRVRAKGFGSNSAEGTEVSKPWPNETRKGISFKWSRKTRSMCLLIGSLENKGAAISAAMGLTNPLEVAWELIPFSFVADWFLPIGKTLSALDATRGYAFEGGCISSKHEMEYSGSVDSLCISNYIGVPYDWHTRTGSCYERRTEFSRSVLTSFPWPQPPQFKNPFSVVHAANAVALLVGVFRDGRR